MAKQVAPGAVRAAAEGRGRSSCTGRRPDNILAREAQVCLLRRLRRQRQVEQICRVPRLVFELLDELDRHHGLGADLDRRLARYAEADWSLLRALGANRFPPPPVRIV